MVLGTDVIYTMLNSNSDSSNAKPIPILEAALENALRTQNTVKYTPQYETLVQFSDTARIPQEDLTGWLRGNPYASEYVKTEPNIGMVMAAHEIPVFEGGIEKFVKPTKGQIDFRENGYWTSKCLNTELADKEYEASDHNIRREKFLEAEGHEKIADIVGYGAQKMDAEASIFYINGEAVLIFNDNMTAIYNYYKETYGLTPKQTRTLNVSHERTHLHDKGTTSEVEEERKNNSSLRRFNEELAEKEPAGYLASKPEKSEKQEYEGLARVHAKDEAGVMINYFWRRILEGEKEGLEEVIEEFLEELRCAGHEINEEKETYIRGKIREEYNSRRAKASEEGEAETSDEEIISCDGNTVTIYNKATGEYETRELEAGDNYSKNSEDYDDTKTDNPNEEEVVEDAEVVAVESE